MFIFHGTAGYPTENWFPWLKEKLEAKGCTVYVPQFPTPEGQSLEAWLGVFQAYQKYVDADTILIGHSLGGIFLLRLLERLAQPVKAAFFTGTPIGIQPMKNYDSDNSFSGFSFDWPGIRGKAGRFYVFQSDNDPYVPLANGEKLAQELGVGLTFIPNAGHFNAKAGYTKFEELLQAVEPLLA